MGQRLKPLFVVAFLGGALILGYWFLTNGSESTVRLKTPKTVNNLEEFSVPLYLSTDSPINAAELYFNFDPARLEVLRIDQSGSFFELWITGQPKFDNDNGVIEFAGGLPKPGFQGKNGLVATVIMQAKQEGLAIIEIDWDRSRVLANDGLGSKVESRFRTARIQVR